MRLQWRIVISVAVGMTVFYSSMVGGRQRVPPMNEAIEVVSAVAPVFPPIVVAANASGNVVIEVKIDPGGNVISTKVLDGHPLLRQIKSIEQTAVRWRFVPAADNSPIRTVRLTFRFEVTPKDTPATELTPVFIPPYMVQVKHLPLEPIIHKDPPTSVRPTPRVKRKP